jgi:hypothetical protein
MITRALFIPALTCFLLLAAAVDLRAQTPAENFLPAARTQEPIVHDKLLWALIGADAGFNAFDGWTTTELLSYPHTYELDPILGRHPSAQRVALTFAAEATLRFFMVHELEKHNHQRVAKGLLLGTIALEAFCGVHNFRMMQQRSY